MQEQDFPRIAKWMAVGIFFSRLADKIYNGYFPFEQLLSLIIASIGIWAFIRLLGVLFFIGARIYTQHSDLKEAEVEVLVGTPQPVQAPQRAVREPRQAASAPTPQFIPNPPVRAMNVNTVRGPISIGDNQ